MGCPLPTQPSLQVNVQASKGLPSKWIGRRKGKRRGGERRGLESHVSIWSIIVLPECVSDRQRLSTGRGLVSQCVHALAGADIIVERGVNIGARVVAQARLKSSLRVPHPSVNFQRPRNRIRRDGKTEA